MPSWLCLHVAGPWYLCFMATAAGQYDIVTNVTNVTSSCRELRTCFGCRSGFRLSLAEGKRMGLGTWLAGTPGYRQTPATSPQGPDVPLGLGLGSHSASVLALRGGTGLQTTDSVQDKRSDTTQTPACHFMALTRKIALKPHQQLGGGGGDAISGECSATKPPGGGDIVMHSSLLSQPHGASPRLGPVNDINKTDARCTHGAPRPPPPHCGCHVEPLFVRGTRALLPVLRGKVVGSTRWRATGHVQVVHRQARCEPQRMETEGGLIHPGNGLRRA